jgi:hypothetical protein
VHGVRALLAARAGTGVSGNTPAPLTADAENYAAGIIDSNYYMTPPQGPTCEIVKVGQPPTAAATISTSGSGA